MKPPDRLLDASGEDGRLARQVFDDGFDEPPPGAKERVWASLSGAIGAPPTSGAGSSTLAAKVVAGVIGVGAIGLGVWSLGDTKHEPAAANPPAVSVALVQPAPVATHAPAPAVADEPALPTKAKRVDTAPSASVEKESALLAESALVARARDALRAGNPGETQRLLSQLGKEFPRGALMQEREAIAIELLWNSGQKQLASERAQAFVRAYPSSVHTARLKAFVPAD